MLITRYAKIVMVACLAIFCLIVVFTNLTDYSTNFLFVKHVLSMDTTFPGNALMYRSITGPALWNAAYVLIIAADAVVGTNPCRGYTVAVRSRPSFCGSSASW